MKTRATLTHRQPNQANLHTLQLKGQPMRQRIKSFAAWACVRVVKYSVAYIAIWYAVGGHNPIEAIRTVEISHSVYQSQESKQASALQSTRKKVYQLAQAAKAKASYVMDEEPPMPSLNASAETHHYVDKLPPLPERVISDTRVKEKYEDELDRLHMKLAQEG